MTLEEYKKIDTNFNQSVFISKANMMIYNIYDTISSNNIDSIKYYMNDYVFNKISKIVENSRVNGQILVFDNIFIDSQIRGFEILDGNVVVKVTASCNFSKYYLSDGNIVSGSDKDLKTVIHTFYFTKNNKLLSFYRCIGCGFSYDIREYQKCPSCGNSNNINKIFDYSIVGMV